MNAIENETPKHRKVGGKRGDFPLYARWKQPWINSCGNWYVWSRYQTPEQRDQAMAQLKKSRPYVEFSVEANHE